MTKIKNKKNDNLIKKRIMDNQCTTVVNTIKEAFYKLFLYKKFINVLFIKLSIHLLDLYHWLFCKYGIMLQYKMGYIVYSVKN